MAASEADVAAHLLERLLAEPDFRARFRRDPAAACREAGLDQLADEMALGAGKAMMTLDIRESKSSLAGVLMAAAMEGVGLYELSEHVLPHLDDVPAAVGDVLSRVSLPSVQGALVPAPEQPAAAPAPEPDEAAAQPESKGASAAAPVAPPEAAPPEPKDSPKESPEEAPKEAKEPPEEPEPPPRETPVQTAPVDPSQLGAEGSGGAPTPETKALLENDNVIFDSTGVADLEAGKIDPRIVAVLTKLSKEHEITVSCMCSDHSKFTSGGSISNHHFGRGVDIAAIDGVPVNASNFDAREIAMELQDLDPSIRPNEIGTPWAISGNGYFTDAGHQDHLHVGFKDELAPGFTPPDDVVAAAPPVAVKSRDTLALATPALKAEVRQHDSLSLLEAVTEQPAEPPPIRTGGYPGDDASKEELAAWMAGEAQKRGLPPELPVMASLVESGLQNLNFGDRDSVGFFQMRTSIWDSGPYAGYQTDPAKQIDWFLDEAEKVKADRLAAGKPIDDPNQYGEWVADVEDCAAEFRYKYQLQLDEAEALLKAAPETPAAPPADLPVQSQPPVQSAPVDPAQFGAEGTGGPPSPETEALLKNDNVIFDSTGVADLKAGRIDPRIVAVLTKLSKDHEITVSCMCSDHSKFTSGGSISNHHFGRGLDIAAIDGVPVNPSNFDAREIAMALQDFDPSIRPNEIGTPWAISGNGYFTDGAHQNHLHIGFKEQITADWKPPGELAAAGAPQLGVVGAPEVKRSDTLTMPVAPELKAAAGEAKPAATLSLPVAEAQTAPPGEIASRGYPGDDATKAEFAAWMAAEAQKRDIPPELPVMAALVESGLQNLDHGHADSIGFFQMRTSIWDSGPYKGYGDDPQKQIDWFLDKAEAVKAKRVAAGLPVDDPSQYGEWIADVELPAEQYRGRYQLQLEEAQGLVKQAPPVQEAADLAPVGGGAAGAKALAAVAEAKKYLGTPYQWGGSTPETNFDCSGLVQWSYAQAGIQIPRVTYDQIAADNGTEVGRDELLPGDLVFFADSTGDVHHVGMSLGGDKFIHAPSTGDVVKISSLNESYYSQEFTGGRRFDAAGSAPPPDPTDVAKAQAHVALDAAEVRRNDSLLFAAIKSQEETKARATVQFLKAIDPSQAPTRSGAPPELAAEAPPVDLAGVDRDYPGDGASQEQLAKWLAKQAEKAGLPPELPVMAALVESGVKNLNYGDRDSVGFFQMRTTIWNSGPYAGYPERPELQAKWFIDNALKVKRARIAAGDVNFGKDPGKWGEWIADVERPAEQYRGRYQLRLGEARTLLR